jgi:hypothetical protein
MKWDEATDLDDIDDDDKGAFEDLRKVLILICAEIAYMNSFTNSAFRIYERLWIQF